MPAAVFEDSGGEVVHATTGPGVPRKGFNYRFNQPRAVLKHIVADKFMV